MGTLKHLHEVGVLATSLTALSELSAHFRGSAARREVARFLTATNQNRKHNALVELWDAYLLTRAESNPDHMSYVFEVNIHDPNTVDIAEVYASQAAFQANTQSEWFGAYLAKVGPLQAGEPAFAMASPYWVK